MAPAASSPRGRVRGCRPRSRCRASHPHCAEALGSGRRWQSGPARCGQKKLAQGGRLVHRKRPEGIAGQIPARREMHPPLSPSVEGHALLPARAEIGRLVKRQRPQPAHGHRCAQEIVLPVDAEVASWPDPAAAPLAIEVWIRARRSAAIWMPDSIASASSGVKADGSNSWSGPLPSDAIRRSSARSVRGGRLMLISRFASPRNVSQGASRRTLSPSTLSCSGASSPRPSAAEKSRGSPAAARRQRPPAPARQDPGSSVGSWVCSQGFSSQGGRSPPQGQDRQRGKKDKIGKIQTGVLEQ